MTKLIERIGNIELRTDGSNLFVYRAGEIFLTAEPFIEYAKMIKMVKSIFIEPTDIVLFHTMSDGSKIGKHKLHDDYICEFPNLELSNGFGKNTALNMIRRDKEIC